MIEELGTSKSEFTKSGTNELETALTIWMNSKIDLIRKNIYSRAKASGVMAQSINIIAPHYVGTTLKTGITMGEADYWVYIDKGVKGKESTYSQSKNSPFSYKLKKPPLAAMQSFIATKGIKEFKIKKNPLKKTKKNTLTLSANVPNENKQMAFMISRSIFKKGIRGTQFFSDVINKKSIAELKTYIKPYLGKEFKIEIKKAWQSQ